MKVLLAGGGTAGHINPAIAIANYLEAKEKEVNILFAGTPKGMEKELVEKAGYEFAPVQVSGFMRKFSAKGIVHNVRAMAQVVTANFSSIKLIREFCPDIVIGTGGYVSGPVVRAATKLGIKTLIHEQNAFPGVTNKLLANKVDCVLVSVEEAKNHFPPNTYCEVVGNPIREPIILGSKKQAREKLQIGDQICVLSFGGSLGARVINRAAADLIAWNYKQGKVFHIHGYGRLGTDSFPIMLEERGLSFERLTAAQSDPNIRISEYLDDMALYLAAADLVICRSGAVTLSELEACGKPSILIPSPYVAENHQYHNAMVLKKHGAAEVITEVNYQKEAFLQLVEQMVGDKKKLAEFGANASKLAVLNTTERIYHIIKKLIQD